MWVLKWYKRCNRNSWRITYYITIVDRGEVRWGDVITARQIGLGIECVSFFSQCVCNNITVPTRAHAIYDRLSFWVYTQPWGYLIHENIFNDLLQPEVFMAYIIIILLFLMCIYIYICIILFVNLILYNILYTCCKHVWLQYY